MSKEIDLIIFETKSKIKNIIVDSKLSPSILEMIMREIYEDMRELSQQNIIRLMAKDDESEVKKDGEHTTVS